MSVNYNDIRKYVNSFFSEVKTIRRHLHTYPELGRSEYKTSAYLQKKLKEITNFPIALVEKTGFCADLIVDPKKPWIALRADMDALPIPDKKGKNYSSKVKGVSHACGHDFHSAVVVGVATSLHKWRELLQGNVRFIFQHAEEPIPGGAIDFVHAGKLNNIQAIFGFHANPKLAVDEVGITPGWITAQSIKLIIELTGPGGHSARPEESVDLNFLGTLIINELYRSFNKKKKTQFPFVFVIGKILSGDSYNSISSRFYAEGTLRVTNPKIGDEFLHYIQDTIKRICTDWEVKTDFKYQKGAAPVVNDPQLTKRIKNIFQEILDENQIVAQNRSMGAEDFSSYLRQIPGVFLHLGVAKKSENAPLHSSYFDINEKSFPFAISLLTWMILRYFKNEEILDKKRSEK
jgi:amidohydrolase